MSRAGGSLAVLVVAGLTLGAQPPAPADLAAMERRAADKSLSAREREQAVDRTIEDRRKLIAAARESEPALTGWLIDQSAAVLSRLGRDGSDSAAIFGIPLASQREAAHAAATEAAADLDRAAAMCDQSARALTAQGIAPEDPRASALEQDRTVRIPFYRARALVILAGLSRDAARIGHAQAAHAAIGKLALASPGPEAARRVCAAAALLMRKEPADPADAQTALDELTWVIRTGAEPGAAVAPMTRAEAWMGLVHAGLGAGRTDQTMASMKLAAKQEPFVKDGRPDALLTILSVDATTRALWERGIQEKRYDLLARAAAAQTALLAREDLGLRPETLRPLVLEKLAIVASGAGPAVVLPPAVRLGRAIVLARDPAKHDEAAKQFRELADAPGADELGADALWEWAVLLTQSAEPKDRLQAARALVRLARDYPAHPRATDAINAALAHARTLAVGDGSDEPARAAYAEALAVATEGYPKLVEIDLWRYERARLLADRPAPAPADLATALSLLDQVNPKAPTAPEAVRLQQRVLVALLDGDFRSIAELRRSGQLESLRTLAADHTLPTARRAVDWARTRAPGQLPRFRLDMAEAMVEIGDPEAAPIYKQLLSSESALPGGAPRVRLGLARALLQGGDEAGAFSQLRDIATRLDAAAPGAEVTTRPEAYWHAWTLMLETLLKQDADGSKRGSIRANVKRLEGIDPDLGGEPWKSRIARVRDAAQ